MRYPSMSIFVFEELKSINVLKSDQKLLDSHISGEAVNGAYFTVRTLDLEDPVTFLTEVGNKIRLRKFYVIDKMPDDINIGKYAMSELGIRWDLKQDFVYLGKNRVPLRYNKNH